ncbi:hypothetical protein F5050DRAFT_1692169 [Lentinula boryana]|uniref:DUF6729 domain-containing protein n=1 Tax=Lentinula boryana TaxID=40481 RepID=A0ABQ8QE10_9AGAR|nr:hypothetical protein F5050DRAFT_1692169 [Lentinula boryana]
MNITTPDSYLNDAKDKKRKPGRPKGTGKKVKDRIIPPKRPVGRPRRDGLPSGSVTVRAKRVVIHLDDDWSKSSQNDPDTFLSSLVVALSVLPPPVSSGPTAEEAFMSHLNSLAPTSAHNHHLPTLYSILKTFWLPTSPAYFSLTASASSRTLSDHRFFYWDPQPLVFDGIACPSCSSLLQNEGRIKRGPLKIYDVERPFFIIGAEYVCKTEGKNFASTDPSILRALPTKLRDELPVRLVHANKDVGIDESIWCWKPAGVSKTLWNLVLGCVRGGLKKDLIVKLIRDTQKGVQQVPIAGPSKSSNQSGFTDAYGDAWTANIATANEEDVQTQHPTVAGPSHSPTQQLQAPTSSSTRLSPSSNAVTPIITHSSISVTPLSSSSSSSTVPHPSNSYPRVQQPLLSSPSNPFGQHVFDYPMTNYSAQQQQGQQAQQSRPSIQIHNPYQQTHAKLTAAHVPVHPNESHTMNPRKPRHCSKCGLTSCKGKGGRSYCTNACKDCGRLECRGRNSRRPDKNCEKGWNK